MLLNRHERARRRRERMDAAVIGVTVGAVVVLCLSWLADLAGWPW